MDLTKRQQEIFDFIKRYSAKYGYPPTVRDIGKAVGLASSSTVHAHLANLEQHRAAAPGSDQAAGDRAARPRRRRGRAASSSPGCRSSARWPPASRSLAEENIEEYIQTPEFAGGEDGEYLLRVRGESMKDAGILDGRPRRRAPAGRPPPTARSSSRWSARRRRSSASSRRPTTSACSPRTTTMEPIRSRDVRVLGKVVGLMRSIS